MLESLLVSVIVVAAFGYAAWALTPAGARVRLARRLAAWGQRPGMPAVLSRATSRLERVAQARLGGCSDCSAAHAPREPPHAKRPSTD